MRSGVLGLSLAFVVIASISASAPAFAVQTSILTLEKTVGLSPSDCADAKNISVDPGTTVYYCYTVTNMTGVTLVTHTLEDSILGSIVLPNGGTFDLAPGGSATVMATSAPIFATTINVATWTAISTDTVTDTAAADQVVVMAESSAQVSIAAKGAPALGDIALAFVAAALLVFGALHLTRRRRDLA